jgi:hypothetical protein
MDVNARTLGEPVFDFLLLVGRVVVGNAVDEILPWIELEGDQNLGIAPQPAGHRKRRRRLAGISRTRSICAKTRGLLPRRS